jgi:hypothetical protein
MAETTQNTRQIVQAPQAGQDLVVTAVPGQDIVLAVAFDQAEAKVVGSNVVFVFANGGQVVLDFSDIGAAQAPNIVMSDGTILSVQEFLASLGEADVEPAAGPDGGATGSGGVGSYEDDAGDIIGGVDKLGGLNPRNFSSITVEGLEASAPVAEEPEQVNIPTLLDGEAVAVEDEKMADGIDEADGGVGSVTGTIVDNVDWGLDGFGSVTGFNVGSETFAAGSTVFWGQDGSFLGTSGEGAAASLLVNADGTYTFTLIDNMLMGQGVQGEQIDVLSTVQIIGADSTGDTVAVPVILNVQDDVPTLTVEPKVQVESSLFANLDETVGEDRGVDADGNADDDGPGLAQVTTSIEGGLAALFTIGGGYGADGPGTTTGNFSFVGFPGEGGLATTLSATDGGAITLYLEGGVIEGRDLDGDTVLTIAIVESPAGQYQLQTTLYEALDHGSDDNLFDSPLDLHLASDGGIQLQYEVTRVDGDGDSVTSAGTIDLITDDSTFFSFEDDGPTLTVTADVSETEAGQLAVNLDETVGSDRGADANGNTDDASPALAQVTSSVTGGLVNLFGQFGGDYGADGPGTTTGNFSFVGFPGEGGLATTLSATDGGAITLYLEGEVIEGRDLDGDTVLTIAIVESPAGQYQLQTTLYEALDHGDDGNLFDSPLDLLLAGEGGIQLQYEVTRVDGDGDSVTSAGTIDLITDDSTFFSFEDDGPTLTVTADVSETEAGQLAVNLDETVGSDRGADANGNTDDASPALAQVTSSVTGGLVNLFGQLGGDYGADGPGTTTGNFSFVGFPGEGGLATTLSATDGGAITLYLEGEVIEGRDLDGDTVLTIAIVESPAGQYQLQTTLYEALDHGDDGNLFDSPLDLLLAGEGGIQLQYEVIRVDGDGDSVTSAGTIDLITDDSTFFSFEDDGPTLTVTADVSETESGQLAVNLDETVGSDRGADANGNTDDASPALAQVTSSVTGGLVNLFGQLGGDYGADGPGTTTGNFSFVGFPGEGGLATTLSATDGGAITLYLEGEVIEGRDLDGDTVLTIAIVESPAGQYQLQTTLYEALDHGDDGNLFDSPLDLLLASEGGIQLQYEVTRVDGDGDSVTSAGTIDLITDDSTFFSFEDDGPTLTVTADVSETESGQLAVNLDETVGSDRGADANGNTDDASPALAQVTSSVTGGLVNLFGQLGGDYGADGPGTTTGNFSFVGFPGEGGLATTLSATDGGAITLYLEGEVIEGRDLDGDTVLTIAIVESPAGQYQLQTTLYEALDHGDDGNLFDSPLDLLLAGEGGIQLQYEVTRVDGDGDSVTSAGTIDLITDDSTFFSFEDDGPTLTVTADVSETEAGQLAVNLDETVGSDRGADANGNTDDASPALAQVTSSVTGGLVNLFGQLGGDYGADGPGTTTGNFSFVGFPGEGGLATTLSATDGGAITLYLEGEVIEGRDLDGDTVLTIAIVESPAGQYQLQTTLYEALDHGSDDNLFDSPLDLHLASDGAIQLQYEVTRVDGDGDSVTSAATVDLITDDSTFFSFDDDGPNLGTLSLSVTGDITHDETPDVQNDLGKNDITTPASTGLGTPIGAAQSVAVSTILDGAADYGSDGEGSTQINGFSLTASDGTALNNVATGLEATNGGEIFLFTEPSGLVVGREGGPAGEAVFSLQIDSTGKVTLVQYQAIDHGDGNGAEDSTTGTDEYLSLTNLVYVTANVTVTDGDGDYVTGNVTSGDDLAINFYDDGPMDYTPATQTFANIAGTVISGDLDTVGTAIGGAGADGFGSLSFAGTDGSVLTGSIAGGALTALTSNGETIYLFGFGTGTLTATTSADNSDSSAVVFVASVQPNADTYTIEMLSTIDNGSGLVFDQFPNEGGGQRDMLILQDPRMTGLDQDLLITPKIPGKDTVNNDADDMGSNNQWIDPGEVIRLDFVTNLSGTMTNFNTLNYTGHYTVNDVGMQFIQTKGGVLAAQFSAYDADDDKILTGDTGDVLDKIVLSLVRVENLLGEDVTASFGGSITYAPDGKSVIVNGLEAGMSVFISTEDGFNRLECHNVDDQKNDAFSLGNFEIGRTVTGDPIAISLDTTLTDGDGDTASGHIDLTLAPAAADNHVTGFDGHDVLYGGAGHDVLHGLGGDDHLYGGAGNDHLYGEAGNDHLYGGPGADTMTGGEGSDTFGYAAGDLGGSNVDHILDFHVAATGEGGDVLDFTGVLSGATHGNLANYLQFTNVVDHHDGTITANLNVDVDGSGSGSAPAHVATVTMTGVDAGADILDTMIHNDEIKIG